MLGRQQNRLSKGPIIDTDDDQENSVTYTSALSQTSVAAKNERLCELRFVFFSSTIFKTPKLTGISSDFDTG